MNPISPRPSTLPGPRALRLISGWRTADGGRVVTTSVVRVLNSAPMPLIIPATTKAVLGPLLSKSDWPSIGPSPSPR